MKNILLLILFFSQLVNGQVKTVYVSPSGAGTWPGTLGSPVNTSALFVTANLNTLNDGDTVRFQRGQANHLPEYQINGNIKWPAKRLFIADYGTGTKPGVSGFFRFSGSTGWTTFNANVKSRVITLVGPTMRFAQFKKASGTWTKAMKGRWPNRPVYYDIAAATDSAKLKFTAPQLGTSAPDFNGGELWHRSYEWKWERRNIRYHNRTAATISLTNGITQFDMLRTFFITQHYNVLDTAYEWTFMPASNTAYVYGLQSTDSVRLAASQYLFDCSSLKAGSVLQNLDFSGANEACIYTSNAQGISFLDLDFSLSHQAMSGSLSKLNKWIRCTFTDIGARAIWYAGSPNIRDENPALRTVGSDNNLIDTCTLIRIGSVPGETETDWAGATAIRLAGSGNHLRRNWADTIGMNVMNVGNGNNNVIEKNFMRYYQCVFEDAGAFSTDGKGWIDTTHAVEFSGNILRNNIVIGGAPKSEGLGTKVTRPYSYHFGIYFDDYSNGWLVENNVAAYAPYDGIYLHNNRRMTLRGNLSVYNTRWGINSDNDRKARKGDATVEPAVQGYKSSYGFDIQNNYTYSLSTSNGQGASMASYRNLDSNFKNWGIINNNVLARPASANPTIRLTNTPGGSLTPVYQAESTSPLLSNASIATDVAGYTGSGFIKTTAAPAFAEMNIPVFENNYVWLYLTYQSSVASTVQISIDGQTVLASSNLVASTTWKEQRLGGNFILNKNLQGKIRVTVLSGTVNIDAVKLVYDISYTKARLAVSYPTWESTGTFINSGWNGIANTDNTTFFRWNATDNPILVNGTTGKWYKDMRNRTMEASNIVVQPHSAVFLFELASAPSDKTAPVAGGTAGKTITATPNLNTITLTWNASTDVTPHNNLRYAVYVSRSNNLGTLENILLNGTLLEEGTGITTYTVLDLLPVTTYHFNIVVTDENGNRNWYTATSATTETPDDVTAPTVGTLDGVSGKIDVSDITIAAAKFTWAKGSDLISPEHKLSYTGWVTTGALTTMADTATATKVFSLPDLNTFTASLNNPNTLYRFTVIVYDEKGNRAKYNTVEFTTLQIPVVAPVTPAKPDSIGATSFTATINIIGVADAAGYYVWRREGTTGDFNNITPDGVSAGRFTDMELHEGSLYQYRVSAYGPTGLESAQSPTLDMMTTLQLKIISRNVYRVIASLQEEVPNTNSYHIDPINGNNSWSGKSPDSAWRTLENVFAKGTGFFQPGDNIKLKAGEVFRGFIRVPAGTVGTPQRPIKVSRYGIGPDPIIDGGNTHRTWYAHPTISGVFVTDTAFSEVALSGGSQVYGSDGVHYTRKTITTNTDEWIAANLGNNEWGYTTTSPFRSVIKPASGIKPDSIYVNCFAAARNYAKANKYVVFENLSIRNAHNGVYTYGDSNIVRNCNFEHLTGSAILSENAAGTEMAYNTTNYTGWTALYFQNAASYLGGWAHHNTLRNANGLFRGKTISYTGNSELTGIGIQQTVGSLIEHNLFENLQGGSTDFCGTVNATIRYNHAKNAGPLAIAGNGNLVYGNIFDGMDLKPGVSAEFIKELVAGPGVQCPNPHGTDAPNIVFNNTVVNCWSYSLTARSNNVIFRNNISTSNSPASSFNSLAGVTTVNSSNNLFYNPVWGVKFNKAGTNYTTLATWQAAWSPASVEDGSVVGNPLFVSPFTGVLQTGSPAKLAGQNLRSAGIINFNYWDYLQTLLITTGTPTSIGAHQ